MLISGDDSIELGALAHGEQIGPGAQSLPRPVERIPRSASVAGGLTLAALPSLVERVAGQRDHMEGIHHRSSFWQFS